jgi:hypothetical protein
MLKKLILALALVGFVGAVTLPSYTIAQTTTAEDTKKKKTTKKKAPSAKQLAARKKFADCAKTWGDHKKATGEKTRKQYNAYMKKCLSKKE